MTRNKRTRLFLFVFGIILCFHEADNGISETKPENQLEINFSGTTSVGTCHTQNQEIIRLLNKIKLSQSSILKAVDCIRADFDGNGSYDFVFFGPYEKEAFWKEKPGETRFKHEPLFMVIFFERNKILRTQILKDHGKDHIALYGPTAKKGNFGESKTNVPGLIQYGEGDDTYIYLYNPKMSRLERTSYASEYR